MKETFIFRKEWKDAISGLPADDRLEIYEAIIEYGTSGVLPDMSPMVALAFNFIKATLDKDMERYAEISRKRSEAGKKGGAGNSKTSKCKQKKQLLANDSKCKQMKHDNDNNNISSKEEYYDINLNNTPFIFPPKGENTHTEPPKRKNTPTIEEVTAYVTEKGYPIDPQHFFDYYEANGWVQGKGKPIKDWKACVRTWVKNEKHYGTDRNNYQSDDHPTNEQVIKNTIGIIAELQERERNGTYKRKPPVYRFSD